MSNAPADWQKQSADGLKKLSVRDVPALELVFLDALAAHLLGPEAPEEPYTIEHGTQIASLLLRSVTEAPSRDIGAAPEGESAGLEPTRAAIVAGARRLGERGGMGAHQLVTRYITAAVGELHRNAQDPEQQVRWLFFYGLIAIASGPENSASAEAAEGVEAAFRTWNDRIGQGFVPPWRETPDAE